MRASPEIKDTPRDEAEGALAGFDPSSLSWVPRKENALADALCRRALAADGS